MSGMIISVLTSSAVDRGFEPRSSLTKDLYNRPIICCCSFKYATLSDKNKDW